jgi:hypothetical protein
MIPLSRAVLWGPMGGPIMGGLIVATALNLVIFAGCLCSMVQGQETASDLRSARHLNYWRRKVQPAEFLPKSRRIAQKSSKMFG